MAETAADDRERQQWLTFALVGAGPTGVELAGQVREIAGHTLEREFQKIDSAKARVLLFEGSDAVLGAFGPRPAHRAARTLQDLGVELHLGTRVTGVGADGLTVQDHDGGTTRFDARTVLWTAGVEAPPIAAAPPAQPVPSRTGPDASSSNPTSPSPAIRRSASRAT